MDSLVENFLKSEKSSNTDYSHKCVAKKFHQWLTQIRLEKDKEKKIIFSREQHKAIRKWK